LAILLTPISPLLPSGVPTYRSCFVSWTLIFISRYPGVELQRRTRGHTLLKKAAAKEELDEAVIQIHISFDLWTSPNRLAFVSIFGHFIDRRNLYQSRLLAFRRQIGSHAGENIAYTVRNVVRDMGIDRKLGVSICDNAASNDVCLRSLYTTLDASVTWVDTEARRIRCFGHILNLVA
jgi:hypothetical protein